MKREEIERLAGALLVGVWAGRADNPGGVAVLLTCAGVVLLVVEWRRRVAARGTMGDQAERLAKGER